MAVKKGTTVAAKNGPGGLGGGDSALSFPDGEFAHVALEDPRVLTMEQHELIRRMVLVDSLSQREVARRLGCSRKTIVKVLETNAPTGYKLEKPKPRPKLEPFIPIVRQWLSEDMQRHRKHRHTAVRVFERLHEHG